MSGGETSLEMGAAAPVDSVEGRPRRALRGAGTAGDGWVMAEAGGKSKVGRIAIALLAVVCLVAIGVVLKFARSVILPLVVAWFLSYLAGPVVEFMVRRKVPTAAAVLGVRRLAVAQPAE